MPGTGLLLLRLAVGVALLALGSAGVTTGGVSSLVARGLGASALLTGGALVVGFLTPGAGVVAAVLGLAGAARPDLASSLELECGPSAALLIAVLSAAVALVGPGAFSIDARLFGRREIVLPPASRHPSPD